MYFIVIKCSLPGAEDTVKIKKRLPGTFLVFNFAVVAFGFFK